MVGNRRAAALDPSRFETYADELVEEARQIRCIVDKPFVHAVGHAFTDLMAASEHYRQGRVSEGDRLLEVVEKVVGFMIDVFPRLFAARKTVSRLLKKMHLLNWDERRQFASECANIVMLARDLDVDSRLRGARIAGPVIEHLQACQTIVYELEPNIPVLEHLKLAMALL